MTQEKKQLLLIDISARLPYKVKCRITKKGVVRELKPMDNGINIPVNQVCDITLKKTLNTDIINDFDNDNIVLKPYLRPMSSMTKEEQNEFNHVFELELAALEEPAVGHTIKSAASNAFVIDFYNRHHFDFRGLIPMGLALEAKEGMYKF